MPSNAIIFFATGDAVLAAPVLAPKTRASKNLSPAPTPVRKVQLAASTRGSGTVHRLDAVPGEDGVLLTVSNGQGADLVLRLHPEHARDLLGAQAGGIAAGEVTSRDAGSAALPLGAVQVPVNAQWKGQGGASRGIGNLVFKTLELVGIDTKDKAAEWTALALGAKLDGQVNEDVYRLQPETLVSLKSSTPESIAESIEPTLVFIHGTFVDTVSSFGKLWTQHNDLVQQLFAHYGDRVYALDHGTVLSSPIANALTLVKRLPSKARLHLVTHSRGGLVAEVLLRASLGVSPADLAQFADPADAKHREALTALAHELQTRQVTVERLVRVACPSHGTLLASNRLDAYLSVISWLMARAGIPLLPDLVDFTNAVARERADPLSLPGIEAMRPSSAVIRWINSPLAAPTASGLRVVAGDITGDSLTSWVKTLLADSYYWTDNDLIVQTRAMYGGVPRDASAMFLLDRSGKTDHFHYFGNDDTANAVTQALLQTQPEGFAPIGPQSRQGDSASGTRAARRDGVIAGDGSRPAVIVLPGILGSNLKRGSEREWLVWHRLFGLIDRIDMAEQGISEDGPIGRYYDDLVDHLRASHDVLAFGYDWRVNLEDSAALLAAQVRDALARRKTSGQPVRLLAHSMGSIVLRVMQLNHPDVWTAMMARNEARVVMMAPPHAGSWAPMTFYTGDDSFGKLLATVGGAFHEQAARQKMVAFLGLLQLQAGLTDPALNLGQAAEWEAMAQRDFNQARQASTWFNTDEQVAVYRWAVPTQADLDAAAALRRRLDAQVGTLDTDATKMAIVLGQAPATPCGIQWVAGGMQYVSTPEGDGRVPWAASLLPNVATWTTHHDHGSLPAVKENFDAYTDLLVQGKTDRLDVFAPARRGAAMVTPPPLATLARLRDVGALGNALPVDEATLLAAALGGGVPSNPLALFAPYVTSGAAAAPDGLPLRVEVIHGDLRFIREPLLLGHFRSLELTGTERVLNGLLGNALQQALDVRLYPIKPGEHQIFVNTYIDSRSAVVYPRPTAAIVVGLGDDGELQPNVLTDAVRQAVLGYQRHSALTASTAAWTDICLASTSLGSGGNLTVRQSVTALVRGVMDANARVCAAECKWPRVNPLYVVEMYQDRALEAWQALQEAFKSDGVQLAPKVKVFEGARTKPPGGVYRGAGYDLIRVTQRDTANQQSELAFAVFTKRARSEVRGKGTQRALVNAMVATAETETHYDIDLARSLFQLLVPQEIKAYLGSANTLLFEVDGSTAAYPWELLEDSEAGQPETDKPWALRMSGALLRKMRVNTFRRDPSDVITKAVLVVGAPYLEPSRNLPALPGAVDEAKAVAAMFGADATLLVNAGFLDIIKAALANPWKVIHLAGHGQYVADNAGEDAASLDDRSDRAIQAASRSGMLMSGGYLFSPTEFESMASVPELVFVNCCHLGKTDDPADSDNGTGVQRNHGLFAANVAEQLIRNGVRCVVAAGWAVDDAAALAFAQTFYAVLDAGDNFAQAVHNARQAAYQARPGSNTWAAYQCYGDPAWTLHRRRSSTASPLPKSTTPALPTESELLIALEAVGMDALSANDMQRVKLVQKLKQLETAAPADWTAHGRVAEAFAMAWRNVGDMGKAVDGFTQAVNAADGTASLGAREQQLDLQAKGACTVADLRAILPKMDALVMLAPTAERYCILGAACQRLANLISLMGQEADAAQVRDVLQKMMKAFSDAAGCQPPNLFYPLMRRCTAQMRLYWLSPQESAQEDLAQDLIQTAPSALDLNAVRAALLALEASQADFWTVVGHQELAVLDGLIAGDLAQRVDSIVAGLMDLQRRVNNQRFWSAVGDRVNFLLPYQPKNAPEQERAAVQTLVDLVKSFA